MTVERLKNKWTVQTSAGAWTTVECTQIILQEDVVECYDGGDLVAIFHAPASVERGHRLGDARN